MFKKTPGRERGSVMIMTAILMAGIILAVGLCIDVARIYMVRAELQNGADAAALAAARELNSGVSGIQDAVTRATTIVNNYGFNRAAVTIVNVEFAVNLNGGYVSPVAAEANPDNIRFVRVTTQTSATPMLFSASVLGASHAEARNAVAGMSVGINTICDFFPVAVALQDPDPAPNTLMTLNFIQGTGNSATVADKDYIILDVPDINGNGGPETAVLSAGLTNICQTLNTSVPFHMTPSANQNNGPRQISDGVNTRFNEYARGYGNALQPGTFPPDSNVQENIAYEQYSDRTAVTPPSPNAPGKDDRRILIVPIVAPGTYSPPNAVVIKFGAFFIRRRSTVQNPCSQAGNCAQLDVEWIDEALVIGRGSFIPGGGDSSLSIPVLYR
ncbi:MAG: pilus assembly protein TadG-related protein [Pyrinomonadaceae bacterium]